MLNIFRREMKANAKAIFIWCLGMVFLIYAGMLKYSGYAATGADLEQFFDQFPPAIKAIIGIGEVNLTTVSGFYSIFFLYFMLLAGAHAVMLGAAILSKEERDRTADFLYVRPVRRSTIVTAKLAAGLVNVVLLNIATLAASLAIVGRYNTTGEPLTGFILRLMLALILFQALFFALGLTLSVLVRTARQAAGLSTLLLLGTFMLSVLIDMEKDLSFLKYLTPFQYFPAKVILTTGALDVLFVVLAFVLVIPLVTVTYLLAEQRDLHT